MEDICLRARALHLCIELMERLERSARATERWLNAEEDVGVASDLENAHVSWLPIYIAMLLTVIQVAFFLTIFECARRSPDFQSVYDRRRRVYESRVPPPLCKRSGRCNGWLAFEWWRVRLSDSEYTRKSMEEEEEERRRDKILRQAQHDAAADEKSDEFLKLAEQECYRNSPYYDPTFGNECDLECGAKAHEAGTFNEDNNLQIGATNPRKVFNKSCEADMNINVSSKSAPEFQQELGIDLDQLMDGFEATSVDEMLHIQQPLHPQEPRSPVRKLWQSLATPSPGVLRNRSCESNGATPATAVSGSVSFSNKPSWRLRDAIGNSERSCRSLRSGSRVRFLRRGDASDREAKRLARLRSGEPTENWEVQMLRALFKAFKKKVLMIRDDSNSPREPKFGQQAHDHVAHKVTRRPLTTEQQELLRCVGLDTFVTLRFLEFGFRTSFLPTVVALAILVPLYVTGDGTVQTGFFRTTILAVEEGSGRYWAVAAIAYLQFFIILRGLRVEWELFLPLRYDFLENGDFVSEKYKDQYQKTCVVEYVPRAQRDDTTLFAFFDCVFPRQIVRAEVLFDTEMLRLLIEKRRKHIMAYEDAFAKKVHRQANCLRRQHKNDANGPFKQCCSALFNLSLTSFNSEDNEIVSVRSPPKAIDVRASHALKFHHSMVKKLNKSIEDEYFRLARQKERPVSKPRRSGFSKFLGVQYLTGVRPELIHSSTAFVEFATLAAKQQAIECNITGTNSCMIVSPVPEVRDIIWANMSVSRRLIEVRKAWANVLLFGGLLFWSFLVSIIRGHENTSSWFHWEDNVALMLFIETYVPVLIVELLVRLIPWILRVVCVWIRFKSASELDHYVLRWYFSYRLMTFIFVIVGGNLVDKSEALLDDPDNFVRRISDSIPQNAAFFTTYVMVAGGVQIFFRFSQVHNLLVHWFSQTTTTREATSQRRLENLSTRLKIFHIDEFIPLFVFIFMVGALYIPFSPISGLFVAAFFLAAKKVFICMTLFTYGKDYEGGGFMFYTLSTILFSVLYIILVFSAVYFSVHGSKAVAGVYSVLLAITYYVNYDLHRTFVKPSKTLSLAKARAVDEANDARTPYERKLHNYERARQALENFEAKTEIEVKEADLFEKLLASPIPNPQIFEDVDVESSIGSGMRSENGMNAPEVDQRVELVARMQRLYPQDQDGDCLSDISDDEASGAPARGVFIYRQPALNRATWEVAPRPYRYTASTKSIGKLES